MSAYGWCWRCAERDGMSRGVELPGDEGPLCERHREELAAIQPVPVRRSGQPDDYRKVTRLGRFERKAS